MNRASFDFSDADARAIVDLAASVGALDVLVDNALTRSLRRCASTPVPVRATSPATRS